MTILAANLSFAFKRLIRLPGFWIPTILFPAMLYGFFGMRGGEGSFAPYVLASFAVYGVLGVAFFQFGVAIAEDRSSAFALWQRTLPAGPLRPWIAQLVTAAAFAVAAVLLVLATAQLLAGVRLELDRLWRLLGVCLLVGVPATFMGTALGYWTGPRSVVGVANLVYLPLAYLGGLWVPPASLPAAVEAVSSFTPTRHMGELAWAAVGNHPFPQESIVALAAFSAGFFALTWLGYRRDRRARFG